MKFIIPHMSRKHIRTRHYETIQSYTTGLQYLHSAVGVILIYIAIAHIHVYTAQLKRQCASAELSVELHKFASCTPECRTTCSVNIHSFM